MKVDIVISSQNDGEFNSYFADGDLCVTDGGFILTYKLGTDDNRLVYNGKSICQSRKGGLTYSVEFIAGKKCSFLFSEMGITLSHEVNVYCAEASVNNNGCQMKITYSDGTRGDSGTIIFIAATYKK